MKQYNEFTAVKNAESIHSTIEDLLQVFISNGYESIAEKMKSELERAAAENIRVVFIGQYSAGKSTIIAALTEDESIKIDSDITTSETEDYNWSTVVLTDTPGLYTGNQEHTQRTIDMIKRADLLIYCITSDLFNQYTSQDFIKWAFEAEYAGKMFLVINKMSKEDRAYEELCESYCISINRTLEPHSLREFPHSFVDAKDYRAGKRKENQELVAFSHFEDFIEELNSFVERKGLLGKLDRPIQLMKFYIDEAIDMAREKDSNMEYYALLTAIEKKVEQQRSKFSVDSRRAIRVGLNEIINKGYELSRKIGVEDMPDSMEDDTIRFIADICGQINQDLTRVFDDADEELNDEVMSVLEGEKARVFFNSVSDSYSEKWRPSVHKKARISRAQLNAIKGIVETVTGKTINLATKTEGEAARFLIQTSEAAGSKLHAAVKEIGSFIGYKFKPWQAAKIAKNIGNAAKLFGPAADVLILLCDVKGIFDEEARANELRKAQLDCRQEFIDVAADLETQYNNQLSKMFAIYDGVAEQIKEKIADYQKLISAGNEMCTKLLTLREELSTLQTSIFN